MCTLGGGTFCRMIEGELACTDRMAEIATYVRNGAMTYLKQQYKIATLVSLLVAIFFGAIGVQISFTE
jgi:K(+)-stimulated pyrophosphate-energized sodium pump